MADGSFGQTNQTDEGAEGRRGVSPWAALALIPIAAVAGAWLMLQVGPSHGGDYVPVGLYLAAAAVASVVACGVAIARGRVAELVLPAAIGALVTRIGLAPLVYYVVMMLVGGSIVMLLFLGPFGLLLALWMGAIMSPLALLLPVVEIIWGEVCAFAMWRDGRLSPVAAVVCGLLQLVPVVGLVAVLVMVVKGHRRRAAA